MNVVKSVFMEMVSMDTLIVKIMTFAQKLVDADRASLFLVDSKTNQLYARIFDVKGKDQELNQEVSKEIRSEFVIKECVTKKYIFLPKPLSSK